MRTFKLLNSIFVSCGAPIKDEVLTAFAFIADKVFIWVLNVVSVVFSGRTMYQTDKEKTKPKKRNNKNAIVFECSFKIDDSLRSFIVCFSSYLMVLCIKGVVAKTVKKTIIKLDCSSNIQIAKNRPIEEYKIPKRNNSHGDF